MRGSFQGWTMDAKRKAVRGMNTKAGLWVFLDDQCPFCSMQYPIVSRMAKELNFEVFYITPDGARPSWLMGTATVLKAAAALLEERKRAGFPKAAGARAPGKRKPQ